jgi:hypothetical protein
MKLVKEALHIRKPGDKFGVAKSNNLVDIMAEELGLISINYLGDTKFYDNYIRRKYIDPFVLQKSGRTVRDKKLGVVRKINYYFVQYVINDIDKTDGYYNFGIYLYKANPVTFNHNDKERHVYKIWEIQNIIERNRIKYPMLDEYKDLIYDFIEKKNIIL